MFFSSFIVNTSTALPSPMYRIERRRDTEKPGCVSGGTGSLCGGSITQFVLHRAPVRSSEGTTACTEVKLVRCYVTWQAPSYPLSDVRLPASACITIVRGSRPCLRPWEPGKRSVTSVSELNHSVTLGNLGQGSVTSVSD